MDLVLGSADDLLGLLAAQLLHGGVVVLLRLGEEHLQDAALVLLLQHVEVVDDHSDGERGVNKQRFMLEKYKIKFTGLESFGDLN